MHGIASLGSCPPVSPAAAPGGGIPPAGNGFQGALSACVAPGQAPAAAVAGLVSVLSEQTLAVLFDLREPEPVRDSDQGRDDDEILLRTNETAWETWGGRLALLALSGTRTVPRRKAGEEGRKPQARGREGKPVTEQPDGSGRGVPSG